MLAAGLAVASIETTKHIGVRRERTDQIAQAQGRSSEKRAAQSEEANIRAANAQEDAVDLAVLQLFLGVFGLAGLGMTVYYARHASITAVRAFESIERPHVYIEGVRKFSFHKEDRWSDHVLPYRIRNHGKTPAIVRDIRVWLGHADGAPPEPGAPYATYPVQIGSVLPCDEPIEVFHRTFELTAFDALFESEPSFVPGETLYFRAVIKYAGPFSGRHETSVCWAQNEEERALVQYGGARYNYNK